jgi:hypothetical protein
LTFLRVEVLEAPSPRWKLSGFTFNVEDGLLPIPYGLCGFHRVVTTAQTLDVAGIPTQRVALVLKVNDVVHVGSDVVATEIRTPGLFAQL